MGRSPCPPDMAAQCGALRTCPWWRGRGLRMLAVARYPSTTPLRVAMSRFGSPRDPKPCPGDMATCPSLPVPGRIRREDGFTLVELMVVLVIIGLLATIVIINVLPAADRAAVTKAHADIATLEQGIEMYRLDNQRYPTNQEGLQVLVAGHYIPRLPEDPNFRLNAYRIIQESLTNVLRYAPGSPLVLVELSRRDERASGGGDWLDVSVLDEGPAPTLHPLPGVGTGRGIIGMQERASLHGGTVSAGPAGSGWRVHATLRLDGSGEVTR